MATKTFPDLFAFDLDGTLVHTLDSGERGVPPDLLKSVHDLSNNASLVVATGRRYRSALSDISTLPEMPYYVLHNGLVIKTNDGKTVFREELSGERAYAIADVLEKQAVDFFVAADGHEEKIDFIFFKESLERSDSLQKVFERTQGVNKVLASIEDLKDFREVPLLELNSVAPHRELLRVQKLIQPHLPLPYRALVVKNIGFSDYGALEIFNKTCSKWTGIQFVMNKLKASRVIAVGDDENDLEMLKLAHIGVAMGHAEPHIRDAGSHQVDGPSGLRKFIEDFYSL